MSKSLHPIARHLRGALLTVTLVVVAILFCNRAQAQLTNTATSIGQLQTHLVDGTTTILLQTSSTLNPIGVLEISEDVTIDGTGYNPSIGGTSNQVFYVDPGVNFTLINVTLSGAIYTATAGTTGVNGGNGGTKGGGGGTGGAGSNALGGAVYNAGNSTFINCLILTNEAIGGAGGTGGNGGNGSSTGGNGGNGGVGGASYGGGIYNIGTILLSNCTLAGNVVLGGTGAAGGTNGSGPFASYSGAGGGGGSGSGAGIYNLGFATIVNSTINQNAGESGAASSSGGGSPGGNGTGAAGPNGAASLGGGVCNFGTNYFLNCTFFANVVIGGQGGNGGPGNTNDLSDGGNGGNGGNAYGGAIYNGTGGKVAVTNCTFYGGTVTGGTNGAAGSGNFAGSNGSPGAEAGANIANLGLSGAFLFKNSILDFPTNTTSAYGTITDQGNNISSDATPTFTTTNSFNSENPGLSPSGLQANGSSVVLTIALSKGSPAINAIYDHSAPLYDERGFVRPGQIRPDIGAYEYASFFSNYNVSGQVLIGAAPFPGVTVNAGTAATVTDTNGYFAFSVLASNTSSVFPNPRGYFFPNSISVNPSNSSTTNLVFMATNAFGTITNLTNGTGTNTNYLSLSWTGIPGFNYVIQAASNLSVKTIVWTNLVTNTAASSNGAIPFTYSLSGTNATNYSQRFFRAIIP